MAVWHNLNMAVDKSTKNIKTTLRIDPYLKSLADAVVVRDNVTFQQIVNNALEYYLTFKGDNDLNGNKSNWVDNLPTKKGLIQSKSLTREDIYKDENIN